MSLIFLIEIIRKNFNYGATFYQQNAKSDPHSEILLLIFVKIVLILIIIRSWGKIESNALIDQGVLAIAKKFCFSNESFVFEGAGEI
ncbi:MAG: hypothetical protein ACFFB1_07910, partial [Promethearchaeota archaeon]